MKSKITYITLTAVIGMAAFFTGKISSEPEPWEVIYPEKVIDWNTDGEELSISTSDGQEYYCYKTDNIYDSDYFDMSTVVDFVATEDGLQLYTADGCGYYWERKVMSMISQERMDTIGTYMDDDIREQVHYELAPCTPEEFLIRYLDLDPDFEDLLWSEFRIDMDDILDVAA